MRACRRFTSLVAAVLSTSPRLILCLPRRRSDTLRHPRPRPPNVRYTGRILPTQTNYCPLLLKRFRSPKQTTPTLFLFFFFFSPSISSKIGGYPSFHTVPFGLPTHTLTLSSARLVQSTFSQWLRLHPPPLHLLLSPIPLLILTLPPKYRPFPLLFLPVMILPRRVSCPRWIFWATYTAASSPIISPLTTRNSLSFVGQCMARHTSGCLLYTSPSPRDRG